MTKTKALRLKNAVFALLRIPVVKVRPATGPKSETTAEPLPKPATKMNIDPNLRLIRQIEKLRLQSLKIVNWFTQHIQ